MRSTLAMLCAIGAVICIIAGDVSWMLRRRHGELLSLRVTGGLMAAGIVLFGCSALLHVL